MVEVSLDAGRLDKRVTIEVPGTPPRVADGKGGFTESWSALATVWAAIEPATAANVERRVGHQVEAKVSHLVTIRYLAGVLTTGRVLFKSRVFQIRGVANRDERNVQLTLACEERV
jgi:SPP1 family predicted phage head-tail adaptor